MTWFNMTGKYHEQTFAYEGHLSSLPKVWQRELAALWRLEVDLNNGSYLQFLANWGRESYVYASQALTKIGTLRMAAIVEQCQALVDEHFTLEGKSDFERASLLPNDIIELTGRQVKDSGSLLPAPILARIYELSYEFMEYPEDIECFGLKYYRPYVDGQMG